jgi:SAM-dependent methyltransferase
MHWLPRPSARVIPFSTSPAELAWFGGNAGLGWAEASALDLPYGAAEFGAVICQQGLQFFPDPAAGVREMVRVVAAGGRIGATVWSASEESPFLHRETEMLATHGGGSQAGFSATEEQLQAWFVAGGLGDVAIERIVVEVDLPPVSVYVPEHLTALPWSVGFFDRTAEDQAAALVELDEALAKYRTSDGIRVPFSSYLVTATV